MTDARLTTFNGPLEAGVRAVAILAAAYPNAFDLQRLVAMDYLLVHTGDLGGPASLHPPTPMQSAALLVRRKLVEQALQLMMARDLVTRQANEHGFLFSAGESAGLFLDGLATDYLVALRQRADWLVEYLSELSDDNFRKVMHRYFDQWVEEFQDIERSLGSEQ